MIDKESQNAFTQQIKDLPFTQYDCLIVKYDYDFYLSSKFLDKIQYASFFTKQQLINSYQELLYFNQKNYNIYIRDSDFSNSPFFVLDDFIVSHEQELAHVEHFCNYADFIFYIETSQIKGKKNYQLGFKLKSDVPIQYKHTVLNYLCTQLECDEKHSSLNKYFRAAGFLNKKALDFSRTHSIHYKNDLIIYKNYKI